MDVIVLNSHPKQFMCAGNSMYHLLYDFLQNVTDSNIYIYVRVSKNVQILATCTLEIACHSYVWIIDSLSVKEKNESAQLALPGSPPVSTALSVQVR